MDRKMARISTCTLDPCKVSRKKLAWIQWIHSDTICDIELTTGGEISHYPEVERHFVSDSVLAAEGPGSSLVVPLMALRRRYAIKCTVSSNAQLLIPDICHFFESLASTPVSRLCSHSSILFTQPFFW